MGIADITHILTVSHLFNPILIALDFIVSETSSIPFTSNTTLTVESVRGYTSKTSASIVLPC